jgi:hypothetical protein
MENWLWIVIGVAVGILVLGVGIGITGMATGTGSTCSDSDNGINASISGAVKYNFLGIFPTVVADACTTDKASVNEKYCNGNNVATSKISCVAGCSSKSITAFGKSITAGACTCKAETDGVFCSRLGKTCGSVTANDNCGTTRTVSSCGNCTITGQICSSTTMGGYCVLDPRFTCNDTDGGINPDVKGIVSGLLWGTPYNFTDDCINNNSVFEFYCINNTRAYTYPNCTAGKICSNGACVCKTPETDSAFCSRLGKTCGSVTSNDNCGVSRTVLNCGNCLNQYEFCQSGTCGSMFSSCSDSDGGIDYNVLGMILAKHILYNSTNNYYDFCTNTSTLIEYSCNNKSLITTSYNCALVGKICSNGACVVSNSGNQSCTDSDINSVFTGIAKYSKGTVSGKTNGVSYSNTDSCLSFDKVKEYYCSGNQQTFLEMNCSDDYHSYICSNGACVINSTENQTNQTNQTQCTDSDGGINYNLKGIVSGIMNDNSYNYTDSCSGNTLTEYACSIGNESYSTAYNCNLTNRNCSNGACK